MPTADRAVMPSHPPSRPSPTPWASGRLDTRARPPRLLFGRTMEDPAVELAVFGPPAAAPVLCIASAGDTALALAGAGHRVIAVDRNPRQLDEVRRRLAGEPPRRGDADRLLAAGRRALVPLGWSPARLARFCALTDPAEQVVAWDALTGPAVRAALAAVLRPAVLRLAFGPAFAGLVPAGFAGELLGRIRRGTARFPNGDNPWVPLLLTGSWPVAPLPAGERHHRAARIELCLGDAADVLDANPPGSLAGVSLSNILDGPDERYRRRLLASARTAVVPGGAVVSRTLFRAPAPSARARAATDRSLLWGGIEVLAAARH